MYYCVIVAFCQHVLNEHAMLCYLQTCSPLRLCYVTDITLLLIHPQGALAVMSLAIFNAVMLPIVNVVILY